MVGEDHAKFEKYILKRNLEKRFYEHKQSIKLNDGRNDRLTYILDLSHTFQISQATLMKHIHCKNPLDYQNLQ